MVGFRLGEQDVWAPPFGRRCHEIDYLPELAYTRGYSISIPIYPPPRKITTDG